MAATDVNGDGNPDLVIANFVSNSVGILLGNGDGTFQPAVVYDTGGSGSYSVAIGDVNRDGKPDLVVANWYGSWGNNVGSVSVLLNNTPFCTTAPVIGVSAMPNSLWPPNGKMVPVTVSRTIKDPGIGCALESAVYAVKDTYGVVKPTGPVTFDPAGAYSFTVLLQASRVGTDLDGRSYTISVSATDIAGKTLTKATKVLVPHDQGH